MARSFTTPDLFDNKGRTVTDATCKAFRMDTHALTETQYTDANGDAAFTALPDNVDCAIMATWGGNSQWFFSEAPPSLTEIPGDLDDISDGLTYARLLLAALTSGKIDFSKGAGFDNKDLDNVADGSSYGRALLTALTTGEIDLSKAGVINKTAANIAETATLKWAGETGADITGDHEAGSVSVANLIAGTITADVVVSNTFKTAASPNARIEITSTRIAGYSDATTKQFYLEASTGKAYCGAGAVICASNGLTIKGQHLLMQDTGGVLRGYHYASTTRFIMASAGVDIFIEASTDKVIIRGSEIQLTGGLSQASNYQSKMGSLLPYIAGTPTLGTSTYYWGDVASEYLTVKEVVTPSAVANFGKLYTKNDNKLYFQSGDGTENTVAYV